MAIELVAKLRTKGAIADTAGHAARRALDSEPREILSGPETAPTAAPAWLLVGAAEGPRAVPPTMPTMPTRAPIFMVGCRDAVLGELQRGHCNDMAGSPTVELVADISSQIAWPLSEAPLSQRQSQESVPGSGWKRLHVRVLQDQESLWWILGLNESIRVHAPHVWGDGIKEN